MEHNSHHFTNPKRQPTGGFFFQTDPHNTNIRPRPLHSMAMKFSNGPNCRRPTKQPLVKYSKSPNAHLNWVSYILYIRTTIMENICLRNNLNVNNRQCRQRDVAQSQLLWGIISLS